MEGAGGKYQNSGLNLQQHHRRPAATGKQVGKGEEESTEAKIEGGEEVR